MKINKKTIHSHFTKLGISRQRGQSATEFVIIVPVLFTLIFGCIQFTLIYQAKTALHYAVFNAVRIGATNGATFESVQRGFAIGMAPFYTYDDDAFQVTDAVDRVEDHIAAGLFIFERINPTPEAFIDFAEGTDTSTGWDYIPNDNLMYRDASTGMSSGLSVQDANLLKVSVTYCYPLSFPFINVIIGAAVESTTAMGTTCNNLSENTWPNQPSIPITASSMVRMQSDVLQDPSW